MLDSIRDLGPVVLIPAAWLAVAASTLDYLGDQGMFIAHIVMVVFISFFAVTGWSEMEDGALRAWRTVLVVGLPTTLAGVAGFVTAEFSTPLFSISLLGWMLLPGVGLAYTAGKLPAARTLYFSSAILSFAGFAFAVAGIVLDASTFLLVGILLVAAGQTAGIADASSRDRA